MVKRNHKQCHDDGLVIEYYSNGGSCEGYYQGGVEEGAWCWWDENGNKQKACHYKEGLKDGLWTEYFSDGKKCCEGEYKGDKKEGFWTSWREIYGYILVIQTFSGAIVISGV